MKINECLIGDNGIVLVPYMREHVPKYHEWMKSTHLQEMTESEPLTLEEEYEMQQSWTSDDNKLTFIILDFSTKYSIDNSTSNVVELLYEMLNNDRSLLIDHSNMCGDVNLFLHAHYEVEEKRAEIEVMIAEENSRRKGIAQQAVQLMMEFGNEKLGLENYEAKILESNQPSMNLFEQKLKFKKIKFVKVFSEFLFEFNFTKNCKFIKKIIKL